MRRALNKLADPRQLDEPDRNRDMGSIEALHSRCCPAASQFERSIGVGFSPGLQQKRLVCVSKVVKAIGKMSAMMIDKIRSVRLTSAFIAIIALAPSCARGSEVTVIDLVKLESPHTFTETVQNLRSTFEAASLTMFAEIDQQQAASKAGLEMPPTTLLLFGNPRSGTPIMLAAPDFALELPLKVLVREEAENRVFVVYAPTSALVRRYGLSIDMADRLAGAELLIASTLSKSSKTR